MATVEGTSPASRAAGASLLFNPRTYDAAEFDPETRRVLLATIEFFESRGKVALKEHDHERTWYADFLEFVAREKVFATLLTPAAEAAGDPTSAGTPPGSPRSTRSPPSTGSSTGTRGRSRSWAWGRSGRAATTPPARRAAELLDEGAIFAFGLSEREHGADIYSTDMVLTPTGDGGFTASGGKYYIGNGNQAGMVSVFGRRADVEGPEGYVFFAADSGHERYRLVQNVVNAQSYVSQFELDEYPVTEADVLHTGKAAFYAALNTVNVGKFNLGFASVGICEHALYEAMTHASNRILYGNPVTDFPHVRQYLTDAYARLVAMQLFGQRATDYFRAAGPDDRRYLLYNPIEKMKVTTEGEGVINLLWDVIAAKGFEKDTYFEMAARDIRGLPKLEGTVHVNMALVLKFMANYFFNPGEFEPVAPRREAADDAFLFAQGPTSGLGKIQFHDWRPVYEAFAARAQRGPLHRAGRGAARAADHRPAGRGPAEGPGLPADRRRAVHARGLRAADPGAGPAGRRGPRRGGPDLRRVRARLLGVGRDAARPGVGHRRPARVGAGRRARPRRRR